MMIRIGATAFAMVVSAGLCAAAAEESVPLKDSDIAAFVAIWPGTAKALAVADPEFDPALTNALASQLEEMAASDSKDSKLDEAAARAGFADFEVFAAFSARVLTAAQWAKDAPDEADLATAIGAVRADRLRTADEKAELILSLRKAYEAARAAKPLDADIATVRPFIAAIDKAIAVDE